MSAVFEDPTEDEDERTNPIGLYNFAVSYHEAGRALGTIKTNTTHPHSPIYFLHYHAIELFLKSYLRLNGLSVTELASKKFGHNANRLGARAAQLGLFLMDEDIEVLRVMTETDVVVRARYIRTGRITLPSLEAVERTCRSLRESVCEAIKKKPVSLLDRRILRSRVRLNPTR